MKHRNLHGGEVSRAGGAPAGNWAVNGSPYQRNFSPPSEEIKEKAKRKQLRFELLFPYAPRAACPTAEGMRQRQN